MREVIGIKNLLDEFRRAKILCGDFRGIKNSFELSVKFGINPLKTFFESTTNREGERVEVVVEGDIYAYTMKDLQQQIENMDEESCELRIVCLIWNKYRTDARNKTVSEFNFRKYA